jgi:polysaccharide export outer membrane protein
MAWLRFANCLLALVAAGSLAACSSSPEPLPPPGTPGATPAAGEIQPADDAPLAPDVDLNSYKLGPNDALRIVTFRHEDLSGEFRLDGTGDLAMPLVGNIPAKGKTSRQLEDAIEASLKDQGYLIDPQVSVEVLEYRDFYIIGEVNQPGGYDYVNGMTVVNAVALAGGFTYRADKEDITLKRGGSTGPAYAVAADTTILPGDVIEVPERFF